MAKKLTFISTRNGSARKIGVTAGKLNATMTKYRTSNGEDRVLLVTKQVMKGAHGLKSFNENMRLDESRGFKLKSFEPKKKRS